MALKKKVQFVFITRKQKKKKVQTKCMVRNTVLRDQLSENVRRLEVHFAFLSHTGPSVIPSRGRPVALSAVGLSSFFTEF